LLPSSCESSLELPLAPVCTLELTSDDTNLTAAEAQALNAELMKIDKILPECKITSEPYSGLMLLSDADRVCIAKPFADQHEESLTTPLKRKRDLRVETPLLEMSESPAKCLKSESLSKIVQEIQPRITIDEDDIQELMSSDEVDELIGNHIKCMAEEVKARTKQEQLIEVNTTHRMDVPTVSVIHPIAPWDKYNNPNSQTCDQSDVKSKSQQFLKEVKNTIPLNLKDWPGLSKIEKALEWMPFPKNFSKLQLKESIDHVGNPESTVESAQEKDIITSSIITWKRDGLRILDAADNNDERIEQLESSENKGATDDVHNFPAEVDVTARNTAGFVRNRVGSPSLQTSLHKSPYFEEKVRCDLSKPEVNTKLNKMETEKVQLPERDTALMLFGNSFSASAALSKFMDIQGQNPVEKCSTQQAQQSIPPTILVMDKKSESQVSAGQAVKASSKTVEVPLPVNTSTTTFIVSTTIMTRQRALFRIICSQYPEAQFVERDFTSSHANFEEADFILSPATGLLTITLQNLKQRPLPGQIRRQPIHERIIALSECYERLIVLVSAGQPPNAKACYHHIIDNSDTDALSELFALATIQDACVLVTYVPGGEYELACYAVSAMVRYSIARAIAEPTRLLQDETMVPLFSSHSCWFHKRYLMLMVWQWEVFLRRLGLNAFAAQTILHLLKNSARNGLENYLLAFLMMGKEERIQRFSKVMGGTRILACVGETIEQQWLSAANGFRALG
jgi:hypothetical protein